MADLYDLTFMDNSTSITDVLAGIATNVGNNSSTPHLIGYFIVLIFFLIFLTMSLRYDFVEILIVDGALTSILTVMLYYSGTTSIVFVPAWLITIPVAITLFAILIAFTIR